MYASASHSDESNDHKPASTAEAAHPCRVSSIGLFIVHRSSFIEMFVNMFIAHCASFIAHPIKIVYRFSLPTPVGSTKYVDGSQSGRVSE